MKKELENLYKDTLFVSDLDGTLLRSDETLSFYTCQTIRSLIEKGILFTYATARSSTTAKKVTRGLEAKMPMIVYNGAFIIDSMTHERYVTNVFLEEEAKRIMKLLEQSAVCPIVYALIDQKEKFSYDQTRCTSGMKAFLKTRKGDPRDRALKNHQHLLDGEVFYFTCIDEEEKLAPLYQQLKEKYTCVYDVDLYTKETWLEIMPKMATKANAIQQLKRLLGCHRVICFGDAKNDLSMFDIADEAYAVANADPELKAKATQVVGYHDEDGVAHFLENYFK